MRLRKLLPAALLLLGSTGLEAAAPPAVVATIKPLHGLASAVMEGVGEPYLLLDGASSPHGYSLRPSEARRIDDADLVLWIGPSLERFLIEPLESLGEDATLLTAQDLPEVQLLAAREGGLWDEHAHHEPVNEDAHTSEEEQHDHAEPINVDPHLWLDPQNALIIAEALAQTLSEQDPANAQQYQTNLKALSQSIVALDQQLSETFRAIKQRPYIVFHDAYHYIEARYGLSPVGSIVVSPDRRPGARRIAEMRDLIEARGAVCIFTEPQFSPALIDSLIEGSETASGTLDPLGATVIKGSLAYQQTLEGLADALTSCLSVSG